jgi:hypothetical protein
MARSSFADLVNSNRLLLDGLKSNTERVEKRGITAEFLTRYQSVFDDVRNTDSAHAALIERSKEKTKEFRIKVRGDGTVLPGNETTNQSRISAGFLEGVRD